MAAARDKAGMGAESPEPGGGPSPRRGRRRTMPVEERRSHILAAALDVFSRQGFAQARLDDVARQAGIAKGTVYLYFPTKEALFEELIRSAVTPVLSQVEAMAAAEGMPFQVFIGRLLETFRTEVLGSERRKVLQLLLREGAQFPGVAAFYHREVVSRGLRLLKGMATRAVERGELASDAAARFPHLIMAPLILCVLWEGLFGHVEPLDVEGLLAAHGELLTSGSGRRP